MGHIKDGIARQKANPEQQRAWARASYQRNKVRLAAKRREYVKNNPERVSEIRKKYNYSHRAKLAVYAATRRGAEGSHTEEEWQDLLRIYNYQCAKCHRSDRPLTEDHKIAIKQGGTNYIDNIQPMCQPCNSQKHATTWFASCPLIAHVY